MKAQVFLPATIIVSVVMVMLIKVRREVKEEALKQAAFVDIKLRVIEEVMRDYAKEKVELKQEVDTAVDQYLKTEDSLKTTQEEADNTRVKAEKCAEEQVRGARIHELLYLKIGEVDYPCGVCFPRMRVSPPLAEIYER